DELFPRLFDKKLLTFQDEDVPLVDRWIVAEGERLALAGFQLLLNLVELRLELWEVQTGRAPGNFFGGVDFVARANERELRQIVVGRFIDAKRREELVIGEFFLGAARPRRWRVAQQPFRVHA